MEDIIADAGQPVLNDADRDSLHTLALSIIPLETAALRRARLIKNLQLRSVVELFDGKQTGSGQLELGDVAKEFGWEQNRGVGDRFLLGKLAALHSYDVYSLRISLRDNGIRVNDIGALKLSAAKNAELTTYMKRFTRPLIAQVYGRADMRIKDFDDVVALFRDPDVKSARQKLEMMAAKLNIGLTEVPQFLEDYGDIFLSLSYYQQCLDQIQPTIVQFLGSLEKLRGNWHLRQDPSLMKTCDDVEWIIVGLLAAITSRFENFERSTRQMWDDISAERFRKVKELIESYHTTVGGLLCALSVKMDAWARQFPGDDDGGLVRRAGFIMSDLKQGIETLRTIEDAAPLLSRLG